eukprot:5975673-Prymnesium_polylepis.1
MSVLNSAEGTRVRSSTRVISGRLFWDGAHAVQGRCPLQGGAPRVPGQRSCWNRRAPRPGTPARAGGASWGGRRAGTASACAGVE